MEYKVTDLMNHYIDEEFASGEEPNLSAERIRRLTMERVTAAPARKKGKKLGPTVLLAAAFALALTATAFAVYQYGLRDVLEETSAVTASGEGENAQERNAISFAGYADSDAYKALLQWQTYERAYLDSHVLPDEFDAAVPEGYLAYGALNQEMMEALDEILEAYGLTLAEGFADAFDSAAQAYALLGSEPFLSGTYKFVTGYAHVSGSFKMENEILLDGDTVSYTLVSSKTDAPMNISGSLPAEDYEEWTYTTASGVTVDISLGQSFAVMLADGPDSHTTITVGRGSEAAENPYVEDYRQAVEGQVADGLMTQEQAAQELSDYEARWSQEHGVITPAQLEAIADSIDFALVAQLGPHGEAERQACLAQKEADDTAYRQSLSDEAGYDGTLTADILEGYELQVDDGLTAEENGGTMMVVRIWETSEGGQIVLEYETMGAGDLVSDGDEPTETTDALGVEAYFVYNENFSEPNRLVWRDEAKGLDFTISSNGGLTAQQMLQQAQRLLADNS